jgi:hypothetical protein
VSSSEGRIYPLLPAIYRQRDAALGRPLEALCKVLDAELQMLRDDIGSLYDQWFIETCSQWIVPYIGQLLGVTGIDTAVANVATQRRRVANTLGYRSRRGTSAVLASACADATGWPALPVEYFERIIATPHIEAIQHVGQPSTGLQPATLDVSNPTSLGYLDGPFSIVSRTVSVAAIDGPGVHLSGSTPEYYNLPNLGLFLWRVAPLPIAGAEPGWERGRGPDRKHRTFHPLGIDTPLLQLPVDRKSPWSTPGPQNMPLSITRFLLAAWLEPSLPNPPALGFGIQVDGRRLPPTAIFASDEDGNIDWNPFLESTTPPAGPTCAVVDPERGRFAIYHKEGGSSGETPEILLDWTWGQPGCLGGGAYDRSATIVHNEPGTSVILVSKLRADPLGAPAIYADLQAAYEAFEQSRSASGTDADPPDLLIRILDSATYPPLRLRDLPGQSSLTIQAMAGERPTLTADEAGISMEFAAQKRASVVISGLLLSGALHLEGELDLKIYDTTVRPVGATEPPLPAIRWAFDRSQSCGEPLLQLHRCITGPLVLDPPIRATIRASIVDGAGGVAISGREGRLGPVLDLDAVSVLGDVQVRALDMARDVLITGRVMAVRISGEVLETALFELALVTEPARRPSDQTPILTRRSRLPASPFVSTRYGDPGYVQLGLDARDELLRGGSGGGELGAYHALASGQRLANLEPVLAEYTPLGVSVGIFVMGPSTVRSAPKPGAPLRRSTSRRASRR